MNRFYCYIQIAITLVCASLLFNAPATAQSSDATSEPATHIYTIGNSLTWDMKPQNLDGFVEFHIDCNKNLQYIFDNPAEPCISTSHLWPDALTNNQYDWISVQPFDGTTLAQDVAIISHWMEMQPDAAFIIHTGWPWHERHEAHYHAQWDGVNMAHTPAYFEALIAELRTRYPRRTIVSTDAIRLLDTIYHDVQMGDAPFVALDDIYRDWTHMSREDGRYLMHNLLRFTLGQPLNSVDFPDASAENVAYFDRKLLEHANSRTDHFMLFLPLMVNDN